LESSRRKIIHALLRWIILSWLVAQVADRELRAAITLAAAVRVVCDAPLRQRAAAEHLKAH
jgi:hypothetical protein